MKIFPASSLLKADCWSESLFLRFGSLWSFECSRWTFDHCILRNSSISWQTAIWRENLNRNSRQHWEVRWATFSLISNSIFVRYFFWMNHLTFDSFEWDFIVGWQWRFSLSSPDRRPARVSRMQHLISLTIAQRPFVFHPRNQPYRKYPMTNAHQRWSRVCSVIQRESNVADVNQRFVGSRKFFVQPFFGAFFGSSEIGRPTLYRWRNSKEPFASEISIPSGGRSLRSDHSLNKLLSQTQTQRTITRRTLDGFLPGLRIWD
jgi:hypothetical protein